MANRNPFQATLGSGSGGSGGSSAGTQGGGPSGGQNVVSPGAERDRKLSQSRDSEERDSKHDVPHIFQNFPPYHMMGVLGTKTIATHGAVPWRLCRN